MRLRGEKRGKRGKKEKRAFEIFRNPGKLHEGGKTTKEDKKKSVEGKGRKWEGPRRAPSQPLSSHFGRHRRGEKDFKGGGGKGGRGEWIFHLPNDAKTNREKKGKKK